MGPIARRWGWAASALGVVVMLALLVRRAPNENVSCGAGFYAVRARCCAGPSATGGECGAPTSCPSPLVMRGGDCDAPDLHVSIPETTLEVGPSDWEAEGRVAPRTLHAGPFEIDAFEASVGHVNPRAPDGARATSGVTRRAAVEYCEARGGRLPTEEEWMVAAAGPNARRYPWGDTGAVCRRAAFGLVEGPCATRGSGPDTVGAHASGDTPEGLHDMAGNVAEWVAPAGDPRLGVAKGGSWQSSLATELRTWARLELDPDRPDARVGFRCAYDRR